MYKSAISVQKDQMKAFLIKMKKKKKNNDWKPIKKENKKKTYLFN